MTDFTDIVSANAYVHHALVFKESGFWVVPNGVTKAHVFLVGGGGAGGSPVFIEPQYEPHDPYDATYISLGGGGGGGVIIEDTVDVTPGETIQITIGAGGVANATESTAGGNTIFGSTPNVIANGGGPGGMGVRHSSYLGEYVTAGGAGTTIKITDNYSYTYGKSGIGASTTSSKGLNGYGYGGGGGVTDNVPFSIYNYPLSVSYYGGSGGQTFMAFDDAFTLSNVEPFSQYYVIKADGHDAVPHTGSGGGGAVEWCGETNNISARGGKGSSGICIIEWWNNDFN